MAEKFIRTFFKQFAMWARLPVPKIIVTIETSVLPNEIKFEIGKESDRMYRLQYIAVYWLLTVGEDPKFKDKVINILVNNLWPPEKENEQLEPTS